MSGDVGRGRLEGGQGGANSQIVLGCDFDFRASVRCSEHVIDLPDTERRPATMAAAAALIQEQEQQIRAQSYYPENVTHNAKQVE